MTEGPTATGVITLPDDDSLRSPARESLSGCGVRLPEEDRIPEEGGVAVARTPLTGGALLTLPAATAEQADRAITTADETFRRWRTVPAPRRGALVRRLGELLSEHREQLTDLVTLEAG